jgi:ABC transporter related protein
MKNYFFKHKGKLTLWILGETLYALCMVLWSFFMKSLSDVAFGGALSGINRLLLIGGGYLILFLIVDYCWKRARARFLQACNQELKVDLLKRILCYDFNSFHNGNTAKYISLLNNDVKIADEQFFRIIPSIINNGIMVLTATIAILPPRQSPLSQ